MVNIKRRWAIFVLLVALAPTVAAAGFKIEIDVPRPRPPTNPIGTVIVEFEDRRESKKGGDEPELIGQVRGGYGNPFGLFTRDEGVDTIVPDMVGNGLAEAGYSVEGTSANSPRLDVRLVEFWTDGYGRSNARIRVELSLTPARSSSATWRGQIDVAGGRALWSKKDLPRLFEELVDEGIRDLAALFSSSDFQNALSGQSARSAAAPGAPRSAASAAPATTGGCAKDTDCKGERICEGGACVEPPPATAGCSKDTDCPGRLVCDDGRCSDP